MTEKWGIPLRPGGVTDEDMTALVEGLSPRTRSALAMYRLYRDAGQLAGRRLVTYRCQQRCLLLDVVEHPEGPIAYWPPVKLSDEMNAVTDADARIERTSDGDRRWIEHADMTGSAGMEYWVSCDHLHNYVLDPNTIAKDATRKAGDVILPSL